MKTTMKAILIAAILMAPTVAKAQVLDLTNIQTYLPALMSAKEGCLKDGSETACKELETLCAMMESKANYKFAAAFSATFSGMGDNFHQRNTLRGCKSGKYEKNYTHKRSN